MPVLKSLPLSPERWNSWSFSAGMEPCSALHAESRGTEFRFSGVNLGGLGFLTEIPLRNLYSAVELMLEGRLEVETRLMLEAVVLRQGTETCRFPGPQ